SGRNCVSHETESTPSCGRPHANVTHVRQRRRKGADAWPTLRNPAESARPARRLDPGTRFCLAWGMGLVSRRGLLLGVGSGVAGSLMGAPASATIMHAVTLQALVQGSRRIVVLTPLAAESHFEDLGRRRRIVTDTRVRVEEGVAKADGVDSEL